MSTRVHKAKGFTLVEILIVVVILGILAAIVIPQFSSASESAKKSSLISQLQTIRSQLELYQIQHNGDYPDLVNEGWDQFTLLTDQDGTTYADQAAVDTAGVTAYGPYMQKAPTNPFEDSSTAAAAAAADVGWEYDVNTGEIRAVIESTKAADLELDTNTDDIATY